MISFQNRLSKLKDRRQGTKERALLENNLSTSSWQDVREIEAYERLQENDAIKYAIGAMAAVSETSTQVSIDEGNRVASTLINMLDTVGIPAVKEIQGSVALDIHIEGHSDVDMLILHGGIVLVETPKIDGTSTSCADTRPMKDIIKELRLTSESKLTSRYHSTNVDCSGSKSIALSGGSLRRKVDIVPSCWYNTHDYQRSGKKADRGVKIYDKEDHKLIGNYPFKHMQRVNDRDTIYGGNLKKVIRLMKNLVADMPAYKHTKAKALSSFDLAGIGYGMNGKLSCPPYLPLALVEELRSYLSLLLKDGPTRSALEVPDGTRKVFNNEDKIEALKILHNEVSDLAKAIYKVMFWGQTTYDGRKLSSQVIQYF